MKSETPTKAELKAENEQLRELVNDMWFWRYEFFDSLPQAMQMEHIDNVLCRMRKLGVGVYNR